MHPIPAPQSPQSEPERPAVDLTAIPLQVPDGARGLLITEVDGQGTTLEGHWLFDPDWTRRFDEDVVAVIGTCRTHDPGRDGIHLTAHLVHDGRVLPLGSWCGLGPDWPETLRHPASTALALHTELLEAGYTCRTRMAG